MKRVHELVAEIKNRYPHDDFFENFQESCNANPSKKSFYQTYERALITLDAQSWDVLKQKAIGHYLNHRNGQLKQGFFNQLNEAFAYRFLQRQGFSTIRFVPENKKSSPDLSFIDGILQRYCEVKTIGLSNDEITRRESTDWIDGSTYSQLNDNFLNKLEATINQARTQINSFGYNGLVFLIIRFDDLALDYYENYRRQLVIFLRKYSQEDCYIKVGIQGHKKLFKKAQS